MALNIDFAFEGFRVIRARPQLIPIWGLVLLVFYAGFFYMMATMMGPVFADLQNLSAGAGAATNPAAVMGIYQRILPMYGILIPGGLVFGAVMNCAVYRAVLEPANSAFGYLRLGGDELRMIGVNLLFMLVFIAAEFAIGIGFGIVLGVSAVAAPKAAGFVGVILGLVVFGLVIWLWTRISLFTVQTFATKKINLFGSWSLTRGHFWTLFGGYIVVLVLAIIVEILFMIIFGVATGLTSAFVHVAPVAPAATSNPFNAFATVFANPVLLVVMALFIVLLAPLMITIMIAPAAAAYRALTGHGLTREAEKVF